MVDNSVPKTGKKSVKNGGEMSIKNAEMRRGGGQS